MHFDSKGYLIFPILARLCVLKDLSDLTEIHIVKN